MLCRAIGPFTTLVIGLIFCALAGTARAAELQAADGANGDSFGASGSLSGNITLVGANQDDSFRGSAYVFRNLDTATGIKTQNVKLTASNGQSFRQFGSQVGLSGSVGLVGAPGSRTAYLFRNLDTAIGLVTESAKLTASDGRANYNFGAAISISGISALVGNRDTGLLAGAAYLFRNLNNASGTVTETAKLVASSGNTEENFGAAVSLWGNLAVVGAFGAEAQRGSAYVFRDLDTATGTITERARLISSDREEGDDFGGVASLFGTSAIVTSFLKDDYRGAAYLFRDLNTATGTVTESAKLVASDGVHHDTFGYSASLRGSTALIGANHYGVFEDDINPINAAYLFRNLDTATGTVTESVKLTASDFSKFGYFGSSVSLDGDGFVIGATGANGAATFSGKAYSGSVSSITTLDLGNASRAIDGISFRSREDWIIGETTDGNLVSLGLGDSASVTRAGKAVHVGKNAGSDGNTLRIDGILHANEVYIGALAGNVNNALQLGNTASFEAAAFRLAPGNILRLEGNFTAIGGLLTYLGETELQVWDGSLWEAVDSSNHASLIESTFNAGYTRITAVPEPSTAALLLCCVGAFGFIRRGGRHSLARRSSTRRA